MIAPPELDVLSLPMPFETPRDINIPLRDEYGVPRSPRFKPLIEATSKGGLGSKAIISSPKTGRELHALSAGERRALLQFEFHPYVVDIREQYPVIDDDKYIRAKLAGRRMLVWDRMTYDIVLTLALPPDFRLHYHGVSIKCSESELSKKDLARADRELEHFKQRVWTWQMLRDSDFPHQTDQNLHALWKWYFDCKSPMSHYDEAREFAIRLTSRSLKGSWKQIMLRHAAFYGKTPSYLNRLLAVAVGFGFLQIDHTQVMRYDFPLRLL